MPPSVRRILEVVEPRWLVHEFVQKSTGDWEKKVGRQRQALQSEANQDEAVLACPAFFSLRGSGAMRRLRKNFQPKRAVAGRISGDGLHGYGDFAAAKPERIISLNIASDEILLALVEPRRIGALTYWSENPAISMLWDCPLQVPRQNPRERGIHCRFAADLVLMPDWQPVETDPDFA